MNSTFFKNINCWQDFDDKLSSLDNIEKGDAFELLTKCYFKIKPQYNHNVFKFRYDNELGSPTTIEGTNNTYWVSYYSDIDVTLISLKENNIILNSSEGKSPYLSID